jgi:hypothetical protein
MTDKEHYKSISLRNHTYNKLDFLSKNLAPGYSLSKAKTVEKLIIDKFDSVRKKTEGFINEVKQKTTA